jgi:transglutaminase-like putative cysteine protease
MLAKETSSHKTTDFVSNKALSWLLIASQLANLLLLFTSLTSWMLALAALCMLWQSAIIIGLFTRPIKGLLLIVAILGCIALAVTSSLLGLLLTMVHLLAFAYVLKGLELKKRSDFYQLILIGIFLNAAAMLFNQNLIFSSLLLLALLLNLSTLFSLFISQKSSFYTQWLFAFKSTGKLILQSIPLTIILFIIFPRLSPFWQVPLAKSAETGLTDEVSLNDITELAKSTTLAFRVNFNEQVPLFNQLYWRAIVLEKFDGKRWQRENNQPINAILWLLEPKALRYSAQQLQNFGIGHSYQVIAEPSYQHWLYALAVPVVHNEQIIMLPDHTLLSKKPLTQTTSYNVSSFLQVPRDTQLLPYIKQRNLRLPAKLNPRLQAEAKKLRSQYISDEALIQQVLANIRQQNYHYTLKPPPLNNGSLDEFYFDTRSGFCMHYASSFTFLMRAAGIPARVITGYMGGEYNRNGDYYSIYQYDAHAWSEVWLADKGWVRVDPTAAVSPERIEQGFSSALFQEQAELNNNTFSLQSYRHIAWLNFLRQQLNGLDYQWTRWVVGYNNKRQLELLNRWFGQFSLVKLAVIMAFTLSSILLWLWFTNRSKKVVVAYPIWQKNYLKAQALLSEKGIQKMPLQSLDDFAEQVFIYSPNVGISFKKLTQTFKKLHYQALTAQQKRKLLNKHHQYFKQFKQQLHTIKRH